MKTGEVFVEKVKVLRGFDRIENKPIVEDAETFWEVVEICDGESILCKNKNGELKMFLIQ